MRRNGRVGSDHVSLITSFSLGHAQAIAVLHSDDGADAQDDLLTPVACVGHGRSGIPSHLAGLLLFPPTLAEMGPWHPLEHGYRGK